MHSFIYLEIGKDQKGAVVAIDCDGMTYGTCHVC